MSRVHVPDDVKRRVVQKLQWCITVAEDHYGRTFKFPNVEYTLRGTTAGTAHYSSWTINLNSVLLMENLDTFIERTVVHEMAHLIDDVVNPSSHTSTVTMTRSGRIRRSKRSVHGPSWKRIMRLFGADPSRCHSYDVSSARVRRKTRHVYECKTCQKKMVIGPVRHKKMQRGVKYWMRGCGRHAGYDYIGIEGQKQEPVAASAAKPKPKTPKPHNRATASKLDACRDLYSQVLSREENIRAFVSAGCTPAGAATYYAKIKKERGH